MKNTDVSDLVVRMLDIKRRNYRDPNIAFSGDPAKTHIEADEVLCEALRRLGFNDLVEIFESLEKWYE